MGLKGGTSKLYKQVSNLFQVVSEGFGSMGFRGVLGMFPGVLRSSVRFKGISEACHGVPGVFRGFYGRSSPSRRK